MTVARKEGRKEGLEEGMEKGRKEGQIEMLKQLVEEGILTESQAADKINMTTDEFLLKTGLKL